MADQFGMDDAVVNPGADFGAGDEVDQHNPLRRGWNKMTQSVGLTGDLATGDYKGAASRLSDISDYQKKNPGTPEGKKLMDAWSKGDGITGGLSAVGESIGKDWKESNGTLEKLRSLGRNVSAMGQGVLEQTPNMVPPMAGMLAGGAAGSVASPGVGTALGGWAGATLGNAAIEGGGMAQEAIQKAGINPSDLSATEDYLKKNGDTLLKQAGVKGAIIGAVDTATAGIGHHLLAGPAKAAASRAATELGIDVADKAAMKAAASEIASRMAVDPVYMAAKSGGQNIARNAGAAALEPTGEFAGEYIGQGVANDEWDTKNAFLEAASSIGQGAATFAGQKAFASMSNPFGSGDKIAPPPVVPPAGADVPPTDPVQGIAPETVTTPGDIGGSVGDAAGGIPAKPSEAMGIKPEAGPLSRVAAGAVDGGIHDEIQQAQAVDQDQAAYDAYMAQQEAEAQQQDTANQAITQGPLAEAQMSDEDKRAVLFSNQAVADGGVKHEGTQDGDILNGMGAPFATRFAAARRAKMEGAGWTIAPVFDGFVARRKDAFNDGNQIATEPRSTEPAEQDGDNAAASVEFGQLDRQPEGDNPIGAVADSLGQSSEQAGGQNAAPVAQGKPQPTSLGKQMTASAGPGFTAKDVLRVENPAPTSNEPTGAQATPDAQAQAVGANTDAAEPAAGAGTAQVEANGVGPASLGSVKADMDHLFGIPQKRAKAIERIAAGKAWFGNAMKAGEFLAKNGLKETHKAVKTSATRWDIQAKQDAPVAPADTAQAAIKPIATTQGKDNGTQTTKAQPSEAQQPAQATETPAGVDHGAQWTRTRSVDRAAIAEKTDLRTLVKRNVVNRAWSDLNRDIQNKLAKAMDASDPVRNMQTANDAAPVAAKPSIQVDKAEMRPYRKADGSVGYEAVPIVDEKQSTSPAVQDFIDGKRPDAPTIEEVKAEKPGTVSVPATVAEAFTAQMQKQKGRITQLTNEAEKAGSLADKRAAQLKVTAAEATLRQMRLKIFDAEDAAVKAVDAGDAKQFSEYADLFPSAAEEITKLTGQNDELDSETRSYEAKANPTYSGEPEEPTVKANTIFTEDSAAKARALLKSKLGQLNSGIDPEMLQAGLTLAGYHIEKGARTFAAYTQAMVDDLGEAVRPYLKSWYMGVKYDPRATGFDGMDSAATVEAADTATKAPTKPTATPEATSTQKSLTQSLAAEILNGKMPKDNPALKKLVEAFDGKPADQARMKEAQEALEAAIVSVSRDVVSKNEGPRSTFDALLRLYESQPNLNIRTSTSIANQAYSTPAPLAYIGSELAGITRKTSVYEPTAGNGMLTIGAAPGNVTVNELEPGRIDSLKSQGFKQVLEGDALKADVPAKSQDRVITNPPFGSVKDAKGAATKVRIDGFLIGQIDHQIAARALETMKDDGKATLIIGANKVSGGLSTDDRIFFNWLYGNYNVASHFEVDGELYNRQGAGWPVRVITIYGRVKSDRVSPVAGTIQRAQNWEQVYDHFTTSLDSIRQQSERGAGASPGGASASQASKGPVQGLAGQTTATDGGHGQTGGSVSDGNVAGASAGTVSDGVKRTDALLGGGVGEQRLNAESVESDRLDPAGDAIVTAPAKPAGSAGATALSSAENQFQVTYEPRSSRKDGGVLIPVNMKDPTQDALSRLEDAVGDIDDYAAKELGYKSVEQLHEALMGLQVDSVASAIYQISQGKGVVIADQTGIGKGRQAASIIRWAERNGYIPVFVSVRPSLFTDMFGDLHDIGSDNIAPFILNKDESIKGPGDTKLFANRAIGHKQTIERIRDSGSLPAGSNAIFMTYSQVNTDNVQRQMLTSIADRAVFILDESHNAGGKSNTGEFVTGVLDGAKGVTYLSATYAKRPDNMPLYFKTDIGQAAADNEGLMDAMERGGLPLQTVVSNNLVKAGQMFRRERSYDGVSIETISDTKNRVAHEKLSDETTKALRAIVAADRMFHHVFVKDMNKEMQQAGGAVIDNAGNQAQAGVDHTQFSSVVHNFVKQMLLGLKAQDAADRAIASLKRNEKPIIAVENTMGSFLEDYAKDNNVLQGGNLGSFDYRTVLSRALARTLFITEVKTNGEKVKREIKLSQLDAVTRQAYDSAQSVIDGLKLDIPVSPIDWMRNEIRKAGYTVAEITGRKLAVDYSTPGKASLGAIDQLEQKDKVRTTQMFNAGRTDALILNVAGSTGISLHASEKFEDQRQRHMIIGQAAGDINVFMQMLGRIHRTGQVALPKYSILSVDLPTEKRPTAVLSGKMKSLNANTSSNTDSATSIKTVDMLNKYGDQVVAQYLRDNYALARELDVEDLIGGEEAVDDLARKATGRLALQPISVQNAFYEEVEAQYSALMDYLNKTNQNELEPRTFDYDARETRQDVLFEGPNKDTPFGEDAIYGEYSIKAQGKAMTPAEIRAAMDANLDGKTAAARMNEAVGPLVAQFERYVSTLEGPSADSARAARATGQSFMMDHPIGSTFRVDINGDSFNAVVTNIKNTHKTSGNPFSLSKIQVTVALNGALRSISVPATQFQKIEVSKIGRGYSVEQLFKEQPANQRETAKIVTGNLLAAYGELQGVRGTIITFTKQDGTTQQGILLPKAFDFKHNTRGDYRLATGADALLFLQNSENKDIGRFGIQSRDGVVRVLPAGQGISVSVPKSKAKGGKYFMDAGLIGALGDFVSSGSAMKATTHDSAEAVKALDLLMKKNALYAIPSMAEEAKTLTGGVKFNVADGKDNSYTPANEKPLQVETLNDPDTQRAIDVLAGGFGVSGRISRPFHGRRTDVGASILPISQEFGTPVVEFGLRDGLTPEQQKKYGAFNGAFYKGTIYMSTDTQRPHLALLGHELLHSMAKKNPMLYGQLVNAIEPYIKVNEYETKFRGSKVAPANLSEREQQEEFMAEVMSDGFMDKEFWVALGRKNPSLLSRIVNLVSDLINKAMGAYSSRTAKYLTDYSKVMKIAGEVMAEYGLTAPTVQDGAIKLNAKDDQTDGEIKFNTMGEAVADAVNSRKTTITGQTNRQYTPAQLAAMKAVGFQVEQPSLKDRAQALWKDAGKKLAQGIADQFAPVKDLDKTAYGLLRLSKGASGAFEVFLNGGKLKITDGVYNFDEANKGGVVDKLLIPLQGEHHDFMRWVAANRAERLQGEGKENLFSAQDIADLKTLADGTANFDYTIQTGLRKGRITRNRAEIYADSNRVFNEFNKNVLDMAEQSGLIDGASRKVWEHEFYVPFYRVADEDSGGVRGMSVKGSALRQQAFKELKGGKNALNADLLDNTLMNWAHLLDASAKNRGAKATIEAAERMGIATGGNQLALAQMGTSINNKNGVVWFMDGGQKRYSLIDNMGDGPYLMAALNALEYAGMRNPVMNAMGAMKHALTVGVTASPFFKVKNLIRDSVQAIGSGNLSYNPAKNLSDGWKRTDPKSDEYFRLLAGGGTIHFGSMLEGSEAKRIQALVEAGVDDSTILNSDQKVKAFYRKFIEPGIEAYNELGNRGEAINRAALYSQLVKQGVNHAEASLQARDLMDFSMQGTFTTIRFLTQVVPFFNARIQGMYKLGRAAKEDPKRFGAILGATALFSLALLAAYGDDDDWKKREEWDRNNFWWFKFGGMAFRIPKPFEIGAIGTLAERSAELAFDNEMTTKRYGKQIMTLLGDNLSMNPVPQMVKPILDVYANKDSFSGRPIETMSMERLQPEYRFTDRTSMTARAVSTAANSVTNLVGVNAPSPVQIDSMLRGYFGWLGSFIIGAADKVARPLTDQPGQAAPDYFKVATGSMVSDLRDAPSRYVSAMYDQAKEIEQAYGTWRALVKEGKTKEAQEFAIEHKDELAKYRQIERVKHVASNANQQIRQIERSSADGDTKRTLIRAIQERKDRAARGAPV